MTRRAGGACWGRPPRGGLRWCWARRRPRVLVAHGTTTTTTTTTTAGSGSPPDGVKEPVQRPPPARNRPLKEACANTLPRSSKLH